MSQSHRPPHQPLGQNQTGQPLSQKWGRSLSASLLGYGLMAAGIGTMAVLGVSPAMAQEIPLRVLTVTGHGSQSIPTTQAQVQLGVEVQGTSAEEVQAEVARRADSVVNYLRGRNVERLETVGVRLNPQYDNRGGRTIVGYTGSNTVSFRYPTAEVGGVLDGAIAAGASRIQGINFLATDAAIAAARQQALQAATSDAQAQANAVLGYLNLGAQEIITIQIDGAQGAFPLPTSARLESFDGAVSTPVIGGEQQVEARVTLQIRY